MRFKTFGSTGLRVSEFCLGTMTFGGQGGTWEALGALDKRAASELVARALEAGITCYDTANVYGDGESERILGRALGLKRKDVVISTKVGFPTGPGENDRGLTRDHVCLAADASLQRLATDYIDLFLVHLDDPRTPLEETMRALEDLVRWGKIRYAGVSNWPAWKILKANHFAEDRRWIRFDVLQAYYSLAGRDLERELAPMVQDQRMGLMAWSPLAGGLLTGKYAEGGEPAEGRLSRSDVIPSDPARVARILEALRAVAAERGSTCARVALAWLRAKPHVTTIVLGARTLAQLEDNLGAADLDLEPGELARLDAASALPPEYPGWMIERAARLF